MMKKSSTSTYAVLLILLVLVAAPLASVLITAVTGYRGEPSALGQLADPKMIGILRNTIWLSVLVVVFSTLMAAPLAFLMSWTPLRRHGWIDIVVMVPFMTPPFAAAMAWMDFTRLGGVAQQLLGKSFGRSAHDFIFSVWGMAFIMACELFPFLYLILRNALDALPASQLEMASVAGASVLRRFRSVIAPLLLGPYSLGALIVFIRAAGEFGTPVTLGNAVGYQVLVSKVHQDITIDPISFSNAAAASSVLFALGVFVWSVQQIVSRRSLTSGGRVSRSVSVPLGMVGRVVAWLAVFLIFLGSVIIPYISIVLGAMTILRSAPPTPNNLTFDYFGIALAKRTAQEALLNSALLGVLGATLAVVLGLIVVLFAYRRRSASSRISDFLAVAPDTVPGIVLAVGFILLWNAPWLPVTPYGTRWILILGYCALFLPMVVQNIKTSFDAISPTVLEAAYVAGASRWHTFVRVQLPLLAPGVLAGWLLAFLVGIRELVMSSLIRPADLQLLSPWIMNQFDQGFRAESMAMTLISVVSSTLVLVAVTVWQRRRA